MMIWLLEEQEIRLVIRESCIELDEHTYEELRFMSTLRDI